MNTRDTLSNSPYWIGHTAYLLQATSGLGEWSRLPRHYRHRILDSLYQGMCLLHRLPHHKLTDAQFDVFRALYKKAAYRADGTATVYPLAYEQLDGIPTECLIEQFQELLTFFSEVKSVVGVMEVAPGVSTLVTRQSGNAPAQLLRTLGPVPTLPELFASWGVAKGLTLGMDQERFLIVVQAAYPNIPEEVALRLSEVEQGTTLAAKVARWDRVKFVKKSVSPRELLTWNLEGYVPAEYETAVSLRDVPPDLNSWRRRPVLRAGRLLHGISDYRLVRNMPSRLKVAETHNYLELIEQNF